MIYILIFLKYRRSLVLLDLLLSFLVGVVVIKKLSVEKDSASSGLSGFGSATVDLRIQLPQVILNDKPVRLGQNLNDDFHAPDSFSATIHDGELSRNATESGTALGTCVLADDKGHCQFHSGNEEKTLRFHHCRTQAAGSIEYFPLARKDLCAAWPSLELCLDDGHQYLQKV